MNYAPYVYVFLPFLVYFLFCIIIKVIKKYNKNNNNKSLVTVYVFIIKFLVQNILSEFIFSTK